MLDVANYPFWTNTNLALSIPNAKAIKNLLYSYLDECLFARTSSRISCQNSSNYFC